MEQSKTAPRRVFRFPTPHQTRTQASPAAASGNALRQRREQVHAPPKFRPRPSQTWGTQKRTRLPKTARWLRQQTPTPSAAATKHTDLGTAHAQHQTHATPAQPWPTTHHQKPHRPTAPHQIRPTEAARRQARRTPTGPRQGPQISDPQNQRWRPASEHALGPADEPSSRGPPPGCTTPRETQFQPSFSTRGYGVYNFRPSYGVYEKPHETYTP